MGSDYLPKVCGATFDRVWRGYAALQQLTLALTLTLTLALTLTLPLPLPLTLPLT